MALVTYPAGITAMGRTADGPQHSALIAKGIGTNALYWVEIDPATGEIPVKTTVAFGYDTNFGVAGVETLRVAALLGNAAGIADFGSGVLGAQTLRNVPASDAVHLLNTRHEAATTPLSTRLTDGTNFYSFQFGSGAVSATSLRTTPASDSQHLLATRHENVATPLATHLSNGSAALAYGTGADGATVLRTTLSTRHETVTTPLAVRLTDGTSFYAFSLDFGASSGALRVAATIGNGSAVADFGSGVLGAQTLRNVPASDAAHLLNTRHEAAATPLSIRKGNGTNFDAYGTGADGATVPRATLSTRHETVTTPIATRESDGTDFFTSLALAASQLTASTWTKAKATVSVLLGWDGTAHREIAVDTSGFMKHLSPKGRTKSNAYARNDYTSTSVTTAAYTQLVASTTAETNRLQIFDSSGQTMVLATGGAGSEVDQLAIPPGGLDIDYTIAASTRVSLKAVSATASVGEIDINFLT